MEFAQRDQSQSKFLPCAITAGLQPLHLKELANTHKEESFREVRPYLHVVQHH